MIKCPKCGAKFSDIIRYQDFTTMDGTYKIRIEERKNTHPLMQERMFNCCFIGLKDTSIRFDYLDDDCNFQCILRLLKEGEQINNNDAEAIIAWATSKT
jgi:hypothetical protein